MWKFPLICAITLVPYVLIASENSVIQSEWIKVPGGQLYCEIAGKGAPLIFLHGYTLDRRMWDPQFFELARKYQVIRYDLRGYGKSRATINIPYSHPADLMSLMNALKIQKAHVVGLSLGASEGVDFLAQYPNRLLSLTVSGGGVSPMRSSATATPQLRAQRNEFRFHQSLVSAEKWKRLGLDVYRREWLPKLRSVCGPHCNAIWPQVRRMVEEWPGSQRLTADYRMRLEPPAFVLLTQTGRPRVPVLVILGGYDKGNRAAGWELARLVPGATSVRIPNAGHLANLECPREFNQVLEKFLLSSKAQTGPH